MCNRYASDRRKYAALARRLNLDLPFEEFDDKYNPKQIFPDKMADVIVMSESGRPTLTEMRWGFEPPQSGRQLVTNVRNVASGFWRPWLKTEFRCLVPATSFSEYQDGGEKGKRELRWFDVVAPDEAFCFAGIWRPWEGARGTKAAPAIGAHQLFSFLTCAPNALVAPVHAKAMPVILSPDDYDVWLAGSVEEALALQKPYPADRMRLAPSA